MFQKYNSLTNHYADKSLAYLREANLLSTPGHVTEKVHGSNFSFIWNNETKTFTVASRETILEETSSFFNFRPVVKDFKERIEALGNHINKDFQLYGEYYGGSVQSEIKYGCEQTFIAFDLRTSDDYFSQEDLESVCSSFGIPCVESLGICTFEELLQKNVETHSLIAKKNGLDSIIEGFVWKPVVTQWLYKDAERTIKERVVIKYKSEAFSERKKDSKQPKVVKLAAANAILGEFENEIDAFINEARVSAVASKIGEVSIKDFGKIIPLFVNDVIDDIYKNLILPPETPQFVTELRKSVTAKSNPVVRQYLLKPKS